MLPSNRALEQLDIEDDIGHNATISEIFSNLFLFFLIFGLSATVDTQNLLKQLGNKWAILTGVLMQFLIMPFLGFLAVWILQDHGLTPAMGLTLLIVASSPGGSYSNWWCNTFNADLALSVAMTAISTLLSAAFLPLNLTIYTQAAYGNQTDILESLDFGGLFLSLVIVMAAILLGLLASHKVQNVRFRKLANFLGAMSGILLIAVSFVLSSSGGEEESHELWAQGWSFYAGVAFPCVLGLVLANLFATLAQLDKPERVTLSVECCYQNVAIGTSAAVSLFDDHSERAQALIVPLYYGFIEAVVLTTYCVVAWKFGWTKAPRSENFFVMMSKSYEVSDIEDEGPVMDKQIEEEVTAPLK
mmetsp:Transcript_12979/g.20184  ORF Transcript_12979/g.20184 Transcript_12979/m.20184 type:complete len:359 (-) Transcript_12979:3076-4152(-)